MRYFIIENDEIINIVIDEVENGILAVGDLLKGEIGDSIKNGKLIKNSKNILTYKQKRAFAYPKIEEQFDMLYHAMKMFQ